MKSHFVALPRNQKTACGLTLIIGTTHLPGRVTCERCKSSSMFQSSGARCSARVNYGDWGRSHQCENRAKMEHEGKHFCGVHDPVKRDARDAAKREEWAVKRELDRRSHERRALALRLLDAVIKNNDPNYSDFISRAKKLEQENDR